MKDEDQLVESWRTRRGLSHHAALEVAAASRQGEPLEEGEPVPGCDCEDCTGVAHDDPARPNHDRGESDLPVEEARRASITNIARRLGLGSPETRGEEYVVRCPFHQDTNPSLRLNDRKGVWFCFPCHQGGDVIDLVMRARDRPFKDAVTWIVRTE